VREEDHADVPQRLVDLTVCVVIKAIAALGRQAARRVVDATIAVVVCAVADLGRHRAACAACIQHAVVDLSIAVIVDAVTDLDRRRAAQATRIEQAFIRLPVAVVVEPIANLDRHRAAATARVEHALVRATIAVLIEAIAHLNGYHAAHAARVQHTVVHLAVAVIVDTVADLCGDGAAAAAGVEQALVGEPIAVVVCAVAALNTRRDGVALAVGPVTAAALHARLAQTHVCATGDCRAGRAAVRHILVRRAVAVVVHAIADFTDGVTRHGVACHAIPIGRALDEPCALTGAAPDRARLSDARITFVDHAVTVVVDAVAELSLLGRVAGVGVVAVAVARAHTVAVEVAVFAPSRALVASVADAVAVRVYLVEVGPVGAVVLVVDEAVPIGVDTNRRVGTPALRACVEARLSAARGTARRSTARRRTSRRGPAAGVATVRSAPCLAPRAARGVTPQRLDRGVATTRCGP